MGLGVRQAQSAVVVAAGIFTITVIVCVAAAVAAATAADAAAAATAACAVAPNQVERWSAAVDAASSGHSPSIAGPEVGLLVAVWGCFEACIGPDG